MNIRRYSPNDLDAVLALFRDSVHAISQDFCSTKEKEAWAPKELDKDRWATILENDFTLVAEIDGILLGFADLTKEGEINHVYVHEDFQRLGIASQLLKALEREAVRQGQSRVTTSSSKVAYSFFLAHGYQKTGEEVRHRRGVDFNNILMEKKLI